MAENRRVRRRDPERTREAILEAARTRLANDGPEGLSLSEVAHLAGVNRGTAIGVVGVALLTYGRDVVVVGFGMLLAWGIAFNLTRAVSVIWVNLRTRSDVRATVLSCLSQAESFGEMVSGSALTILAKAADMRFALLPAGVLLALAGVTVARFGAERTPSVGYRRGTL
jgi:hypothetical protein